MQEKKLEQGKLYISLDGERWEELGPEIEELPVSDESEVPETFMQPGEVYTCTFPFRIRSNNWRKLHHIPMRRKWDKQK